MAESKHTPGPWTLETVKTSVGFCHKVGPFPWGLEKQNHACIYVDYGSHEGVLLANARLIAAAPDLLEALKSMLTIARIKRVGQGDEITALQIEKARAAIVAAEGET